MQHRSCNILHGNSSLKQMMKQQLVSSSSCEVPSHPIRGPSWSCSNARHRVHSGKTPPHAPTGQDLLVRNNTKHCTHLKNAVSAFSSHGSVRLTTSASASKSTGARISACLAVFDILMTGALQLPASHGMWHTLT